MRRRSKSVAVLGAVTLLTGALMVVGPQARAQTNGVTVQVSAPLLVGRNCNPDTFRGCRTGESMRYLAPSPLRVHKGDTITFDFAGFHTASLIPVGTDILAFRGANTGGVGKPYSMFIADPDDTTAEGAAADKPAVKTNPVTERPSIDRAPVTCGAPDNPCIYDGTKVVNSGVPLGPPPQTFTVRIDANPGQSFWVECFLHTHMFQRVTVVADNEATTSQADIDSAKEALIAHDRDWAEATDAQLINKPVSHTTASGQKVYDVFVGKESHFANLNGFYPRRTTIPRGATVRFHWSDLVYENHTATMPLPGAASLFDEFFMPQCDPDGDSGPGPDNSGNPDAQDPSTFCPDQRQFELDLSSRVFHGFGDGIFRGASDLEHSGIRGAQFSMAHMDVKFEARSSEKGWKFFCMLHPMGGRVIVKPTR